MSRYRSPAPTSSPYITRCGFDALQAELVGLWTRRTDVVAALSAAAAEGDRSENAEYHYRKKELGGIDRRIRYLQKRLPTLKIVTQRAEGDQVFFGARVSLLTETEGGKTEQRELRLVGPDEIDPSRSDISIDSPVARALLGKRRGDSVSVAVDGTMIDYEVVDVSWPA